MYIWFVNSLVYYGLNFLSSAVHENIYISLILLSLAEAPGILLTSLAVERFSRKSMLIVVMVVGGLSCTATSLMPLDMPTLKSASAIFGKVCISGSFALIYVYTAEIFPTVLRVSGLGICSISARFGGMLAPYLLNLVRLKKMVLKNIKFILSLRFSIQVILGSYFPFFTIGVISLLAGLAAVVLPETRDQKLPDSLEELERRAINLTEAKVFYDVPASMSSSPSSQRADGATPLDSDEESCCLLTKV